MENIFVLARLRIAQVGLFLWLAAVMSVGSVQAAAVSYILDDGFLADGTQMTGALAGK